MQCGRNTLTAPSQNQFCWESFHSGLMQARPDRPKLFFAATACAIITACRLQSLPGPCHPPCPSSPWMPWPSAWSAPECTATPDPSDLTPELHTSHSTTKSSTSHILQNAGEQKKGAALQNAAACISGPRSPPPRCVLAWSGKSQPFV